MPLRSAAGLLLLPVLAACAHAADSGEDMIRELRKTAQAQSEDRSRARAAVQAALREYDDHAAEADSSFARIPEDPRDKKWVAAKLRHMAAADAHQRNVNIETPGRLGFSPAEKDEFRQRLGQRAKVIDDSNRADLKRLLKIHPWFKISEFGEQADKDAFYLVQHADADPAFQAEILGVLERMAAAKETNPKNYAFLYDRVAISYERPENRKPQRYGTQGECLGPGRWEVILPIEDVQRLDDRRKELGLGPHADYKKLIEEKLCR